jgi:hypothetical protein
MAGWRYGAGVIQLQDKLAFFQLQEGVDYSITTSARFSYIVATQSTLQPGEPMKTYVLTTGVIFGLLAIAHVWRMISESHDLASDPWYILITLVAALLSGWAFYVARRTPPR